MAHWVDDLWGDNGGTATANPPVDHSWVNDLWDSTDSPIDTTPPQTAPPEATPAAPQPVDPSVPPLSQTYSPSPATGAAPPDANEPTPLFGDKVFSSSGKTWRQMSPDEQQQALEIDQIKNEKDPSLKKWLAYRSVQADSQRQAQPAVDADAAANRKGYDESAKQVVDLQAERDSTVTAYNANQGRLKDLGTLAESDAQNVSDLTVKAQQLKDAGDVDGYNKAVDELKQATADAQGSADRYNRLSGGLGKYATRFQEIQQQLPEAQSKHEEFARIADQEPWRFASKEFHAQMPAVIPQQQLDAAKAQIDQLPDGPEKDQLYQQHAEAVTQRAQVVANAKAAMQNDMTPNEYRGFQMAGQDLDRSQMTGGSVTSSLPWRVAEKLGGRVFGGLGNIEATVAAEAGNQTVAQQRKLARQYLKGWSIAQQRMSGESGIPGDAMIGDTLAMVGEFAGASMVVPGGAIAYTTVNSTAEHLAQADEQGITGANKYVGAAVHGAIDGLSIWAGSKLGAGLASLGVGGEAGDTLVGRAVQAATDKFGIGKPLSKIIELGGESGSQVALGIGMTTGNYLTDVVYGNKKFDGQELAKQLLAQVPNDLATGALAGAVHQLTGAISKRFDVLKNPGKVKELIRNYQETIGPSRVPVSDESTFIPGASFRATASAPTEFPAPPSEAATAPQQLAGESQPKDLSSVDTLPPPKIPSKPVEEMNRRELLDAAKEFGIDKPNSRNSTSLRVMVGSAIESEQSGDVTNIPQPSTAPPPVAQEVTQAISPPEQSQPLPSEPSQPNASQGEFHAYSYQKRGSKGAYTKEYPQISHFEDHGNESVGLAHVGGTASFGEIPVVTRNYFDVDTHRYIEGVGKFKMYPKGDAPDANVKPVDRVNDSLGRLDSIIEARLQDPSVRYGARRQLEDAKRWLSNPKNRDRYQREVLSGKEVNDEPFAQQPAAAVSRAPDETPPQQPTSVESSPSSPAASNTIESPASSEQSSEPTPEPSAKPDRPRIYTASDRPTLSADDFEHRIRAAATSPEEAEGLLALAKANAEYRGESLDDWAAKHIADVQKTNVSNSKYLKQHGERQPAGTIGPGGEALAQSDRDAETQKFVVEPSVRSNLLNDANRLLKELGLPTFKQRGWSDLAQFARSQQRLPDGTRAIPDRMIADILAADEKAPGGKRVVRGETQFLDDGRAIIRAFNDSQNVATLAHEVGHVFRRTLRPEELAKAESSLGVRDGDWQRSHEERFARMFERYLRNGNAPTPTLRGVFDKFKNWLTTTYRNLATSPLGKDIPPELHDVFDKMLGGKIEPPNEILGYGSSPARRAEATSQPPGTAETPPASRFEHTLYGDKGFVGRDVVPTAQGVVGGLRQAADQFLSHVAPQLRSADAAKTAKDLREYSGTLQRFYDSTENAYREANRYFAAQPDSENIARIQKAQTGELKRDGTPGTDMQIQFDRDFEKDRRDLEKVKPGITDNFGEWYFPQQWKDPAKAQAFLGDWMRKRPLEGSKGFLKQRKFPTVGDGIKAGLELETTNLADLALNKRMQIRKYVEAQKTLQDKWIPDGRSVYFSVNQQRSVPDGWVQLKDPMFTKYGPPTVAMKEYVDAAVYDKLSAVAERLGIKHTRKASAGRGQLGFSEQGANRITTQSATDLSVIAHEIGHQLDYKYGLRDMFGLSGAKQGGELAKEFRSVSDLRFDGQAPNKVSASARAYTRKPAEKIAQMVEAFVHAPERMQEVAPQIYSKFKDFIGDHPELADLADAKPSLALRELEFEKAHGGLLTLGHYYAPEQVATVINNFMSPGLEGKSTFFAGLQGVSRLQTQFNLGLSAFHAVMTARQAASTELSLALRSAAGLRPKEALEHLLSTPAAPLLDIWQGHKLQKAWVDPTTATPEYQIAANAMQSAGGRAVSDQRFALGWSKSVKEELRNGNWVGAGLRAVPAAIEQAARPLMEKMVPKIKAGAFFRMMQQEHAANPGMTPTEVRDRATRVWNSVDNRMGQVVQDNTMTRGWVRSTQNFIFRAFQYQAGTGREFGGAAIDTARQAMMLAKGEPPELTHKMAYAISDALVGAAVGGLMTYLATGRRPETIKDLFFPRDGGTDHDGNPTRSRIPGYINDLAAVFHAPVTAFEHKMNPLISEIAQLYHNRDYFGEQIYGPEGQGIGHYLAKQAIPFSIQNLLKQREQGASLGTQAVSALGIGPAPGYITKTPAQSMADGIAASQSGNRTLTAAEAERFRVRRQLTDSARQNADAAEPAVRQAFDNGQITEQDAKDLYKQSTISRLEYKVKGFTPKQALRVYDIANDDERKKLYPIIAGKVARSNELSDNERQALLDQLGPAPDGADATTVKKSPAARPKSGMRSARHSVRY